jgi:hypothetical protein
LEFVRERLVESGRRGGSGTLLLDDQLELLDDSGDQLGIGFVDQCQLVERRFPPRLTHILQYARAQQFPPWARRGKTKLSYVLDGKLFKLISEKVGGVCLGAH